MKKRIASCVGDSCRWMNCNDLKLNENKAEVVLISSKFRNGTYLDYVSTHVLVVRVMSITASRVSTER